MSSSRLYEIYQTLKNFMQLSKCYSIYRTLKVFEGIYQIEFVTTFYHILTITKVLERSTHSCDVTLSKNVNEK